MNTVDLQKIFMGLQSQMISTLSTNREITHPGTKGNASEIRWREWLGSYLPKRYQAENAFVVDSNGFISEQIDVVIFDRQYSPFILNQDGAYYVPAESVYAVLEIKQTLNKAHLEYARSKAASVENLHRTNNTIVHAGGTITNPRPIPKIITGILTLDCAWAQPISTQLFSTLSSLGGQIDIGCALQVCSFDVDYSGSPIKLSMSNQENALIYFFFKLFKKLQLFGTAPAIDVDAYARVLDESIDTQKGPS